MKLVALAPLAAAGLLAACGGTPPDPWVAQASFAAVAQPGVASLLRAHSTRTECEAGAPPAIEIVTQGTLGVASVAPTNDVIAAPDEDCDGQAIAATGVFYEAPAGAAGLDRIVYRELRGGVGPDVIHSGEIRVR